MCYDNEKAQLMAYRRNVRRNGHIAVKYRATKSLSLSTIRRAVRHTLCKDTYVDIDVENCHPVILNQICEAL
jgi:hypothetical protein